MQKLIVSTTLIALLLVEGLSLDIAMAADSERPFLIGALTESWGATPAEVGLRDGLVTLGYRENEHFIIGSRFTQGDSNALPAAARQLVEYEADLIFAVTARAAKAAQQVTTQIPIVFAGAIHPLKFGLVQSFARPGSNITGVTNLRRELSPKRLELFRQLIPGLKRVLLPYDADHASSVAAAREYREAARYLGVALIEQPVRSTEEAQRTLAQVSKGGVDGIIAPRCCAWNIAGFVLEIASGQAIPTMFGNTFFVERGGLASYGADNYASGKQAARLVDKILKGANPAEIPVEVNSNIEFSINLKTAKQLGITIPPEVLYQATKVIR